MLLDRDASQRIENKLEQKQKSYLVSVVRYISYEESSSIVDILRYKRLLLQCCQGGKDGFLIRQSSSEIMVLNVKQYRCLLLYHSWEAKVECFRTN